MAVYNTHQFQALIDSRPPAGSVPDRRSDLAKAIADDNGQLPMFATAGDLKDNAKVADVERHQEWYDLDDEDEEPYIEDDAELWDRKLIEAESYGLASSIEDLGVRRPVRISAKDGTIKNGYHRTAAAADIESYRGADDPVWVPLNWDTAGSGYGSIKYDDEPMNSYDLTDLPHHRDRWH